MSSDRTLVPVRKSSFEDFRGDFAPLAAMVREAWVRDPAALDYDEAFLRSQFDGTQTDLSLVPTLYKDSIPAAFVAGFPRQVVVEGRTKSLVISAYLSVASAYQKYGLGAAALRELALRAAAAGHDGLVAYCVEGGPMNDLILALGRHLNAPVTQIHTVRHMSRTLFPRLDAPEPPPQSVDELVEALLTLSADVRPRASIARVWTPELAAVQCGDPYAVAQHLRIGDRSGLMTGRCMRTLAGDGAIVVLLEDILWGGLAEAERALLLDQFLSRARGRGAQLAVAPDLGYADLTPLRNARFRSNQRVLNAYLISFTGDPPPGPASAMYLKVF